MRSIQLILAAAIAAILIAATPAVAQTGAMSGGEIGSGSLVTTGSAYAPYLVIKGTSGTLISLIGYHSGTTATYIQLLNSATLPPDGSYPKVLISVAADSNFSVDVPITGVPFSAGVVVASSSSAPALALSGSNCWFSAVVK